MQYFTLRNGVKLPQLGFGTYKVEDPQEGKHRQNKSAQHGLWKQIDQETGYLPHGDARAVSRMFLPELLCRPQRRQCIRTPYAIFYGTVSFPIRF